MLRRWQRTRLLREFPSDPAMQTEGFFAPPQLWIDDFLLYARGPVELPAILADLDVALKSVGQATHQSKTA